MTPKESTKSSGVTAPSYFTSRQVARIVGCPLRTTQRAIKKSFPNKVGHYRLDEAELEALKEAIAADEPGSYKGLRK